MAEAEKQIKEITENDIKEFIAPAKGNAVGGSKQKKWFMDIKMFMGANAIVTGALLTFGIYFFKETRAADKDDRAANRALILEVKATAEKNTDALHKFSINQAVILEKLDALKD